MSTESALLLLANLVAAGILTGLLAHHWRTMRELRQRLRALSPKSEVAPLDGEALLRPGLISIEILNPLELAAKESRFAGTLSSVTPHIVQRLVVKRAAQIIREELAARGVVAEVRQHHGD